MPGSAHFALGRPGRGLVAFVLTVGLFVAGYMIVGTHLWYHELISMRDGWLRVLAHVLPVSMLPESLNLGCTAVVSWLRDTVSVEAERLERMPTDMVHLGLLLTASSGLVNCLWMCDAHWIARGAKPKSKVSPPFAAAMSWLLPGAGHVLAGQKDKGILLGVVTWAMFFAGLVFSDFHAVDRVLASAWFDGQVLFGGGVIFGSLLTAPLRYEELPLHLDLGITLCTVAGFMNLLVMCNAYTVAEDGPESFVSPPSEPVPQA